MELKRRGFLFGLAGAAAFPAIARSESLMRITSRRLGEFSDRDDLLLSWQVHDTRSGLLVWVKEADIHAEPQRYMPYYTRAKREEVLPLDWTFRTASANLGNLSGFVLSGPAWAAEAETIRETQLKRHSLPPKLILPNS